MTLLGTLYAHERCTGCWRSTIVAERGRQVWRYIQQSYIKKEWQHKTFIYHCLVFDSYCTANIYYSSAQRTGSDIHDECTVGETREAIVYNNALAHTHTHHIYSYIQPLVNEYIQYIWIYIHTIDTIKHQWKKNIEGLICPVKGESALTQTI